MSFPYGTSELTAELRDGTCGPSAASAAADEMGALRQALRNPARRPALSDLVSPGARVAIGARA
ncbi:MAG: hypothetical protein ACRDZX_05080 [Acidimicrobiales bacterium]